MRSLYLAAFASLYACGSDQPFKPVRNVIALSSYLEQNVAPEARPHLAEFLEYCKTAGRAQRQLCLSNLNKLSGISLNQGVLWESRPDVIGYCAFNEQNNNRDIVLRGDVFDQDSIAFKTLVWHELGHCLLDLDHNDDGLVHFMNSNLPQEYNVVLQWSYLVREIFTTRAKDSQLTLTLVD